MALDHIGLRDIRKKLTMTQSEFAEKVMKQKSMTSTLSKMERNETDITNLVEKKIRQYLQSKFKISMRIEKMDDFNPEEMGGALGGAILGIMLLGVTGGAIGALAGAAALSSISDDLHSIVFRVECPWCKKRVEVIKVDKESEYACGHCKNSFQFSERRKKAIKIAY